ncbi:MAG: TIR domain-containing protein [Leptolyngbyaceae cyanobacterium SL_5_9]|nr:TIR domain-containing protein [Leptolyngbyaceae cyanobacterium SM1_4_3]NJN57426.1 TIR domain-containing protein [Leptolyngbyaceae cyanobacterium SL_5_9]NJO74035.1 TIR domain-containing protein [Leptolyngbyaceae cyanobacterium RM1_406_9]
MYKIDDVFISYNTVDDLFVPEVKPGIGWVTFVYKHLVPCLRSKLGTKDVEVFFDVEKLRGNTELNPELCRRVKAARTFVAIMSEGFIQSSWCLKETAWFYESLPQKKAKSSPNWSPVFKLDRQEIDREREVPQELLELHGLTAYKFYIKPDGVTAKELRHDHKEEAREELRAKIDDVAQDLAKFLKAVREQVNEQLKPYPPPLVAPGTGVYLAEAMLDRDRDRSYLRRELEQWGCTVFPDQPLPSDPSQIKATINEYLRSSSLSIHPLGAWYNAFESMQVELAQAHKRDRTNFSYLIWLPPQLAIQDEQQRKFIQLLENVSEPLKIALEEFKEIVSEQLISQQPKPDRQQNEQSESSDLTHVYLIYDQRDRQVAEALEDALWEALEERGVEVIIPVFEGDVTTIREHHQASLLQSQAAIIYCSDASLDWLRVKQSDLRGASGRHISKKFIYIGGSETPQKRRYRTAEAQVIHNFGSFSHECFETEVIRPMVEG